MNFKWFRMLFSPLNGNLKQICLRRTAPQSKTIGKPARFVSTVQQQNKLEMLKRNAALLEEISKKTSFAVVNGLPRKLSEPALKMKMSTIIRSRPSSRCFIRSRGSTPRRQLRNFYLGQTSNAYRLSKKISTIERFHELCRENREVQRVQSDHAGCYDRPMTRRTLPNVRGFSTWQRPVFPMPNNWNSNRETLTPTGRIQSPSPNMKLVRRTIQHCTADFSVKSSPPAPAQTLIDNNQYKNCTARKTFDGWVTPASPNMDQTLAGINAKTLLNTQSSIGLKKSTKTFDLVLDSARRMPRAGSVESPRTAQDIPIGRLPSPTKEPNHLEYFLASNLGKVKENIELPKIPIDLKEQNFKERYLNKLTTAQSYHDYQVSLAGVPRPTQVKTEADYAELLLSNKLKNSPISPRKVPLEHKEVKVKRTLLPPHVLAGVDEPTLLWKPHLRNKESLGALRKVRECANLGKMLAQNELKHAKAILHLDTKTNCDEKIEYGRFPVPEYKCFSEIAKAQNLFTLVPRSRQQLRITYPKALMDPPAFAGIAGKALKGSKAMRSLQAEKTMGSEMFRLGAYSMNEGPCSPKSIRGMHAASNLHSRNKHSRDITVTHNATKSSIGSIENSFRNRLRQRGLRSYRLSQTRCFESDSKLDILSYLEAQVDTSQSSRNEQHYRKSNPQLRSKQCPTCGLFHSALANGKCPLVKLMKSSTCAKKLSPMFKRTYSTSRSKRRYPSTADDLLNVCKYCGFVHVHPGQICPMTEALKLFFTKKKKVPFRLVIPEEKLKLPLPKKEVMMKRVDDIDDKLRLFKIIKNATSKPPPNKIKAQPPCKMGSQKPAATLAGQKNPALRSIVKPYDKSKMSASYQCKQRKTEDLANFTNSFSAFIKDMVSETHDDTAPAPKSPPSRQSRYNFELSCKRINSTRNNSISGNRNFNTLCLRQSQRKGFGNSADSKSPKSRMSRKHSESEMVELVAVPKYTIPQVTEKWSQYKLQQSKEYKEGQKGGNCNKAGANARKQGRLPDNAIRDTHMRNSIESLRRQVNRAETALKRGHSESKLATSNNTKMFTISLGTVPKGVPRAKSDMCIRPIHKAKITPNDLATKHLCDFLENPKKKTLKVVLKDKPISDWDIKKINSFAPERYVRTYATKESRKPTPVEQFLLKAKKDTSGAGKGSQDSKSIEKCPPPSCTSCGPIKDNNYCNRKLCSGEENIKETVTKLMRINPCEMDLLQARMKKQRAKAEAASQEDEFYKSYRCECQRTTAGLVCGIDDKEPGVLPPSKSCIGGGNGGYTNGGGAKDLSCEDGSSMRCMHSENVFVKPRPEKTDASCKTEKGRYSSWTMDNDEEKAKCKFKPEKKDLCMSEKESYRNRAFDKDEEKIKWKPKPEKKMLSMSETESYSSWTVDKDDDAKSKKSAYAKVSKISHGFNKEDNEFSCKEIPKREPETKLSCQPSKTKKFQFDRHQTEVVYDFGTEAHPSDAMKQAERSLRQRCLEKFLLQNNDNELPTVDKKAKDRYHDNGTPMEDASKITIANDKYSYTPEKSEERKQRNERKERKEHKVHDIEDFERDPELVVRPRREKKEPKREAKYDRSPVPDEYPREPKHKSFFDWEAKEKDRDKRREVRRERSPGSTIKYETHHRELKNFLGDNETKRDTWKERASEEMGSAKYEAHQKEVKMKNFLTEIEEKKRDATKDRPCDENTKSDKQKEVKVRSNLEERDEERKQRPYEEKSKYDKQKEFKMKSHMEEKGVARRGGYYEETSNYDKQTEFKLATHKEEKEAAKKERFYEEKSKYDKQKEFRMKSHMDEKEETRKERPYEDKSKYDKQKDFKMKSHMEEKEEARKERSYEDISKYDKQKDFKMKSHMEEKEEARKERPYEDKSKYDKQKDFKMKSHMEEKEEGRKERPYEDKSKYDKPKDFKMKSHMEEKEETRKERPFEEKYTYDKQNEFKMTSHMEEREEARKERTFEQMSKYDKQKDFKMKRCMDEKGEARTEIPSEEKSKYDKPKEIKMKSDIKEKDEDKKRRGYEERRPSKFERQLKEIKMKDFVSEREEMKRDAKSMKAEDVPESHQTLYKEVKKFKPYAREEEFEDSRGLKPDIYHRMAKLYRAKTFDANEEESKPETEAKKDRILNELCASKYQTRQKEAALCKTLLAEGSDSTFKKAATPPPKQEERKDVVLMQEKDTILESEKTSISKDRLLILEAEEVPDTGKEVKPEVKANAAMEQNKLEIEVGPVCSCNIKFLEGEHDDEKAKEEIKAVSLVLDKSLHHCYTRKSLNARQGELIKCTVFGRPVRHQDVKDKDRVGGSSCSERYVVADRGTKHFQELKKDIQVVKCKIEPKIEQKKPAEISSSYKLKPAPKTHVLNKAAASMHDGISVNPKRSTGTLGKATSGTITSALTLASKDKHVMCVEGNLIDLHKSTDGKPFSEMMSLPTSAGSNPNNMKQNLRKKNRVFTVEQKTMIPGLSEIRRSVKKITPEIEYAKISKEQMDVICRKVLKEIAMLRNEEAPTQEQITVTEKKPSPPQNVNEGQVPPKQPTWKYIDHVYDYNKYEKLNKEGLPISRCMQEVKRCLDDYKKCLIDLRLMPLCPLDKHFDCDTAELATSTPNLATSQHNILDGELAANNPSSKVDSTKEPKTCSNNLTTLPMLLPGQHPMSIKTKVSTTSLFSQKSRPMSIQSVDLLRPTSSVCDKLGNLEETVDILISPGQPKDQKQGPRPKGQIQGHSKPSSDSASSVLSNQRKSMNTLAKNYGYNVTVPINDAADVDDLEEQLSKVARKAKVDEVTLYFPNGEGHINVQLLFHAKVAEPEPEPQPRECIKSTKVEPFTSFPGPSVDPQAVELKKESSFKMPHFPDDNRETKYSYAKLASANSSEDLLQKPIEAFQQMYADCTSKLRSMTTASQAPAKISGLFRNSDTFWPAEHYPQAYALCPKTHPMPRPKSKSCGAGKSLERQKSRTNIFRNACEEIRKSSDRACNDLKNAYNAQRRN